MQNLFTPRRLAVLAATTVLVAGCTSTSPEATVAPSLTDTAKTLDCVPTTALAVIGELSVSAGTCDGAVVAAVVGTTWAASAALPATFEATSIEGTEDRIVVWGSDIDQSGMDNDGRVAVAMVLTPAPETGGLGVSERRGADIVADITCNDPDPEVARFVLFDQEVMLGGLDPLASVVITACAYPNSEYGAVDVHLLQPGNAPTQLVGLTENGDVLVSDRWTMYRDSAWGMSDDLTFHIEGSDFDTMEDATLHIAVVDGDIRATIVKDTVSV